MKEKSSTEMGRAQSDSTSLTLACRKGLRERGKGEKEDVRHMMEEDETEAAAETGSCSRVRMWFGLGQIGGRLLTPPESDGTAASPPPRCSLTVPARF